MWRQNTPGHALPTSSKQTKRPLPVARGSVIRSKTIEGREKIAAANLRNGEFTQAKIAKRKKDAKVAKGLRDRLRLVEQNLRRHGVID